ncbi:MAG: YicC family protein [Burkholderiales bacterium]|nr:YicC family protein [Burkholderiales bacterium]
MAVYSMTGYASAQIGSTPEGSERESKNSAAIQIGLEIRAVNSRFLDLSFKLPDELRQYEPALRELLVSQLKRGKVEVRMSQDAASRHQIPEPSARLLQRLNSLQDSTLAWLPKAQALSVADVIRLAAAEQAPLADISQEQILTMAAQATTALLASRQREGERLGLMLTQRIEQLRKLAAQAVPLVPKLVAQQRQRFIERWQEAMALADSAVPPEAAQDRALTEATAFAIRIDVAEEITRLNSHLDELDRLILKGGEIGKRLDFLIQELHREANTMGSKSAALELTHISVDMKVLIEQMREQVQNIE